MAIPIMLILFIICIFLAIPYLIATFYRIYYNCRINAEMQSGNPRKHLTPMSVFFNVAAVEIILIIIFTILGNYDPDSNDDPPSDSQGDIHPVSELQGSLYEDFNGQEIKGYSLSQDTPQSDFEILNYTNDDSFIDLFYDAFPQYISYVQYTGDESIVYYYAEITWEWEENEPGNGIANSYEGNDSSYLFAIDCTGDEANVEISLYLFNQEDYDTYLKEVDPYDELIIEKNEQYATAYLEYTISD